MKKLVGAVAGLMALAAFSAGGAVVFPAGNFTVYGMVRDWGGGLVGPADEVTVMALGTDGTVLATGRVGSPVGSGEGAYNYRLTVPVASAASGDAVTNGAPLRIVIASATSTYRTTAANSLRVSGAFETVRANFQLATDSNGDGIADQYVAELAPWMDAYGYGSYDPDADWDGDGASNRDEYIAGTNPFDPSDAFKVTELAAHKGEGLTGGSGYSFVIRMETVGGRSYSTVGTGSLAAPVNWTNETFYVDTTNSPVVVNHAEYEDVASRTFYLLPVGDRHFWKVMIDGGSAGTVPVESIEGGK